MTHDRKLSRFVLSALPFCAALALACSGAEDTGDEVPSFVGPVPGGASAPTPGTGDAPGAPQPSAVDPAATQPAAGARETPVTSGGTPLAPSPADGNGAPPTGDGTPPAPTVPQNTAPQDQVPQNPTPQNPEPQAPPPVNPPPRNDGVTGTTNLFTQLLGRSQAEVDQKVQTAVNRFFGIGTTDPAVPTLNGGARSFYTLPQDSSLAFVYAADSADIRSEGMSYGMFIAVQMNMQQQFDQLWRFARTFMQYPADSGPTAWHHYFRWTGGLDTSNANNWQVTYNATESPASDGEEYFAVALYLADRRWGSNGAINYEQDADALASAMLHNEAGDDGRFPLIHAQENMVVFVPYGTSNEFSDPSYHVPAFYEIFAQDGPAADAARWLEIADRSRQYFVDSANQRTGLHPDYANFDGSPSQGFAASNHDTFSFDAWRVPLNMAVDYAWSREDPRLRTQVERYHTFFGNNLTNGNLAASVFNLDGSGGGNGNSAALMATLAAGALASNGANRMTFVNGLWNAAQPTGNFRYYNGAVYLLGLLATSGNFDFAFPR
jgi:oligosaccharide reducing-end xylanase